MKNIYVSRFKNYKSPIPESEISLWDWLKDDILKEDVENIRTLENKDDRNKLKANLPCITPSGTFTQRKASCLIKHSGYMCIDIDSGDNKSIIDFTALRDQLKNILNIAYAGLSVSGKGVFCLIPIKYPEKHKEHFEALKICFEGIGVVIDKACADVSRLRGFSYDENAFFNENAIVFDQILDYQKKIEDSLSITPYKNIQAYNGNVDSTKHKVMKVINKIDTSNIDITDNYDQWFQIGCALANEFDEDGREMFHLVSKNHPKYNFESCDIKFTNIKAGNYKFTIGTFFHWAEKYGIS